MDKSRRVTSEQIEGQFDRHHQDAVGDLSTCAPGQGFCFLALPVLPVAEAAAPPSARPASAWLADGRNSRLPRPVGSGIGGSGSRCRRGQGSQGAWAGPRATPVQLPCLFILWRIVLAGSDLVWALLRAPQAAWRQKCGAGKQQCVRAGRAA